MKTTFFIFILFIFISLGIQAQEVLVPMSENPVLTHQKITTNKQAKGGSSQAVKLPFIDDFSYNRITPSPALWSNNYVLINNSFAVNPTTKGVATFDAVNDTGNVYSHASQFPFIADSLTSNKIRLDSSFGSFDQALSPADSVYLSFFFQPQGLGNPPEESDSLILQFFNPLSEKWNSVWQHEGMSLDSFRVKYGQDFKMVMIPIVSGDYFSNRFRFRFLNKVSIPNNTIPSWRSGLYDQWNIDYVYLDKDRNLQDTSFNDIAWIDAASSFLTNYVSMPWNQYQANTTAETNTNATLKFRNLDYSPVIKNVNQYLSIQNLFDKSIHQSSPFPSAFNMNSGTTVNYAPNYEISPGVPFTFQSSSPNYADFEILFRILTNTPPPDIIRTNDSMRFYQRFYNYYSYDDGVPEAGYGLSNVGARLAYQFTLNQGDSLQSIQMYFNQTLGLSSQQYFFLTIWDDNNGQPGNVIYEQSGLRPEYESDLFQFYTYELKNALFLTGTFYVGWRQTTVDNLNVGFDKNNDHHDRIFYNTSGSWNNSSYVGSLMIRPVMGNEKTAWVGMENQNVSEIQAQIYPNPINGGKLHIDLDGISQSKKSKFQLQMYSITGQLVFSEKYSDEIDVEYLAKGMYFVRISSPERGVVITKKIVIQ